MKRDELIHIVRASANITGESRFLIIGSQAILGTSDDAPEPMVLSMEADIYPLDAPERADLIDGAIGEGSQFHSTFGYYAHGVGPATATCPAGWESRLEVLTIPAVKKGEAAVTVECLEVHDLVLSKCVAGRERDWEFAEAALAGALVDSDLLLSRVADLPIDEPARTKVRSMIVGIEARIERKR